jgi:hypothetical protein
MLNPRQLISVPGKFRMRTVFSHFLRPLPGNRWDQINAIPDNFLASADEVRGFAQQAMGKFLFWSIHPAYPSGQDTVGLTIRTHTPYLEYNPRFWYNQSSLAIDIVKVLFNPTMTEVQRRMATHYIAITVS